ncbi:unnamed protein product [Leptidea sinapis]|uniref:WAP domain-containing protein n=1 Tax=Leptidea sinapis TaxID=189913 RepID=A0A5E4PRA1_9NEOP|nr:unnamed protein product [Leptidea sinapis]
MIKYLCFLLVSYVFCNGDLDSNAQVYNELPCLLANGVCTKGSCPSKTLEGFCPTQQSSEVECCVSLSANPCHNHQGACLPKEYNCPTILTFNDADDCADDEKCCILVH